MASTLVVYKGNEVVKEEPKSTSGKTTVTITGLDSNTDIPSGTYKVSWKVGDKESEKVDVPVSKTDKVAVEHITVNNNDVTLDVGDTFNIKTTVKPTDADNKDVTYTSNNSPVATVTEAGVIEGVKSGNATITIKSKDNSSVTEKVKVRVEEVEDTSKGDEEGEETE